MPFRFIPQAIPEVFLILPSIYADERGSFLETCRASLFLEQGIPAWVQENRSLSGPRVLRGLHFQKPPAAQGKLISVLQGAIFDVAVDLRRGSPTFGGWVGIELRAADRYSLFVPSGFAHGFCVLGEGADVAYKITHEYAPEQEGGLAWNDPTLNIPWPVQDPILSPKDQQWPLLADLDSPFRLG